MKRYVIYLVSAGLFLLLQPTFAQKAKLAKVALGMSETEVKSALEAVEVGRRLYEARSGRIAYLTSHLVPFFTLELRAK